MERGEPLAALRDMNDAGEAPSSSAAEAVVEPKADVEVRLATARQFALYCSRVYERLVRGCNDALSVLQLLPVHYIVISMPAETAVHDVCTLASATQALHQRQASKHSRKEPRKGGAGAHRTRTGAAELNAVEAQAQKFAQLRLCWDPADVALEWFDPFRLPESGTREAALMARIMASPMCRHSAVEVVSTSSATALTLLGTALQEAANLQQRQDLSGTFGALMRATYLVPVPEEASQAQLPQNDSTAHSAQNDDLSLAEEYEGRDIVVSSTTVLHVIFVWRCRLLMARGESRDAIDSLSVPLSSAGSPAGHRDSALLLYAGLLHVRYGQLAQAQTAFERSVSAAGPWGNAAQRAGRPTFGGNVSALINLATVSRCRGQFGVCLQAIEAAAQALLGRAEPLAKWSSRTVSPDRGASPPLEVRNGTSTTRTRLRLFEAQHRALLLLQEYSRALSVDPHASASQLGQVG